MDLTDRIIAYESGQLSDDEVVALFQSLVDTGLAWQLQGSYGRTAHQLIQEGLVIPRKRSPALGTEWPTPAKKRLRVKKGRAS